MMTEGMLEAAYKATESLVAAGEIGAEEAVERARLRALEECVRAVVLRSFHESGAFGSVALKAWPGAGPDLEFVLVDKKGYAPERWLFKARRYLRFSGLEARIAFARKGNVHSGWVRARIEGGGAKSGMPGEGAAGEDVGLRLVIDAGEADVAAEAGGDGFQVRIVESGGRCLGSG